MKALSDEEFIDAWHKALGSPAAVQRETGLSIRGIYSRRARLAERGVILQSVPKTKAGEENAKPHGWTIAHQPWERRRRFEVTDGTVVMFSDCHWLPDHHELGQKALEAVIRELKPKLVVCGGDALNADVLGRWDPTRGHHRRFDIREELECVREHFDRVEACAGPKTMLAWVMGNHDLRLSRWIAVNADKLLNMPYTRLEEWVPRWPLSWTVEVNSGKPSMTVLRHRNLPGMLHLQSMKAGTHYCHGHRHKIGVHIQPTFSGYLYSVDAGSLSDPDSDAHDYEEGAPAHAQGFAVLTYRKGRLLPPELCVVSDGVAVFRGQIVA